MTIRIKPSHCVLFHKEVDVPEGKKILEAKIKRAERSTSAAERKRAVFADSEQGWKHTGHHMGKIRRTVGPPCYTSSRYHSIRRRGSILHREPTKPKPSLPDATKNAPDPHPSPPSKRDWNEIREYSAVIASILAVIISIASAYYSATSSRIEEERYREAHSIIVLADKDPSDKMGFFFKLRPQDSAQRLEDVRVTFPSAVHAEPISSNPGEDTLTLYPVEQQIHDLCVQHIGRKQGYAKVTQLNLPVILDTTYSMGGKVYQERGIYYLRAWIGIADSPGKDTLQFTDLAFSGALAANTDGVKTVDNLFNLPPQPTN